MRLHPKSHVDIETPSGLMRTHLFRAATDRKLPAVMLFSEIYQVTGPIARTAAWLAGHGYLVAVPEVYHEYAEPGEAFAYDKEGTDRGNALKTTKSLAAFDADARTLTDYLRASALGNGFIASLGICLGGHLAFRAAMHPSVHAGVCLYATDIHKRSLGSGMNDDTLTTMNCIKAKMLMIWGRQDPHIPLEGRQLIYQAMHDARIDFTWHEFNGEHAFLRDEGHRYDASVASLAHQLILHHLSSAQW